jgi:hypothetical protein
MAKKSAGADHAALEKIARNALVGVAEDREVGQAQPIIEGEGFSTARFSCEMSGYPGWLWEVNLAPGENGQWGVLELHLVPGPDALLAPEWVPWSERLEEYKRLEAERGESAIDDDDDDIDLDDEIDDLDGVDIDELDLGALDFDPGPLEVPSDPNDVFDHVELDNQ